VESGTKQFDPTEIHIHSDWNVHSERYDADIAIIYSESSVQLTNNIRPVCLRTINLNDDGIVGTVVGWGRSETSQFIEDIPKEVQMKTENSARCYENFYQLAILSSQRTYCSSGVVENSGPCTGDSGEKSFN